MADENKYCEVTVNNVPNDKKIIVSLHKITGQSLSLVMKNLAKGLPIFSKDISQADCTEGGIVERLLDFFQENNIDVTIDYDNKKETIYEFRRRRIKELSQELYMLYLKDEGYVPEIDEDGLVSFKYPEIAEEDEHCVCFKYPEIDEGDVGAIIRVPYDGICSIQIDSDDLDFFRLVHIGFWGALDALGKKRLHERLYKAASETNAKMKLTKTFVLKEHCVVVTTAMIMGPSDKFTDYLDRMLAAIRDTLVMFEKNIGRGIYLGHV
jgi:hypothetical protein